MLTGAYPHLCTYRYSELHTQTQEYVGSIRSTSSLRFVLCCLWCSQCNLQNCINTSEWGNSRYRPWQPKKKPKKTQTPACVRKNAITGSHVELIRPPIPRRTGEEGPGEHRSCQSSTFPLQLRLFSGSRSEVLGDCCLWCINHRLRRLIFYEEVWIFPTSPRCVGFCRCESPPCVEHSRSQHAANLAVDVAALIAAGHAVALETWMTMTCFLPGWLGFGTFA